MGIKQMLCRHRYQSFGHCSRKDGSGRVFDTDYVLKCEKCGKEKTVHTYGYDFNLNGIHKGGESRMQCRNCDYKDNCKRQCMELPAGTTCADCVHVEYCTTMYGVNRKNTSCDFEPVKFIRKTDN